MPYAKATLEQVDAALFALASNASAFVTKSRRLIHWSDCNPADQPALFLASGDLEPKLGGPAKVPGMPYQWRLHRKIYIYVNVGSDDLAIPSTAMNPVLNAVLAAIAPTPLGDRQTLSGLVHNVSLNGRIMTDEGLLGPQAVAILPIEVLTGEL